MFLKKFDHLVSEYQSKGSVLGTNYGKDTIYGTEGTPFEKFRELILKIEWSFPNVGKESQAKEEMQKTYRLMLELYKEALQSCERGWIPHEEQFREELINPLRGFILAEEGIYKNGWLKKKIGEIENKYSGYTEYAEYKKIEDPIIEEKERPEVGLSFEEREKKWLEQQKQKELEERAKKKKIPTYWVEKAPERKMIEKEEQKEKKTKLKVGSPTFWQKIKKWFGKN